MKASGVQVLVRTLGHVVRGFSRLPKQVRYIALQHLAVSHPLNTGLAVRPFTSPGQDGKSDKKPAGDDNKTDNWASYILDQANRSGAHGEKWKEQAFLAAAAVQKPRRRLHEWLKLGIALGAVLGTLGIAYESGWIKYQEAKGLFQAIKEGFGIEDAARIKEKAKLFKPAVTVEYINVWLLESLKGFRQGQKLKVGHETSTILAANHIPKPTKPDEQNLEYASQPHQQSGEVKPEVSLSENVQPSEAREVPTISKKEVDPLLQLDLIDFGPFIYDVLRGPEKVFILVDGMKGCGKSTSMQLLCSHVIQQGCAAVYINFVPGKQPDIAAKEYTAYLLADPARFLKLTTHFKKRNGLTVVLDDFNHYIKADRQNAAYVVYNLWKAASGLGTRVIFTTGDYGLGRELTSIPGRESTRIEEIRINPPPADQLTKLIKQALTQLDETNKEGNSDQDIAMYCEIVSTLRDVLDNYLVDKKPKSVREITIKTFNRCLTKIKRAIGIAAGDNDLTKAEIAAWKNSCVGWFWRIRNEKCDAIADKRELINWKTNQVREILETLTNK